MPPQDRHRASSQLLGFVQLNTTTGLRKVDQSHLRSGVVLLTPLFDNDKTQMCPAPGPCACLHSVASKSHPVLTWTQKVGWNGDLRLEPALPQLAWLHRV